MPDQPALTPAADLAALNKAHHPGESPVYREARNALLVEEIEVRRAIERLGARRRALPEGGVIPQDFALIGEQGHIPFSGLFGDKDTLMVYSMMFGPQRKRPCPMCTSFLNTWNGTAFNLRQRVALAVTARSPVARIVDFKHERGWQNLPVFSDGTGDYTRTYVSTDDADVPGFSVFTRSETGDAGVIRHFWSGEFSGDMADPGQDPRGAPDIDLLWTMLDLTPTGRGKDWYPKLEY